MSGYAPLAMPTVESWSRMTGHDITPLELEGLLDLDAVMRHPEPPEEKRRDG
jgi:hypothetical protein